MSKKNLMTTAIGIGALVLLLTVGTLFFTGNEEGAGVVALAAAAAASAASRRRAAALEDLDKKAEEAEDGITGAEGLREAVAAANDEIDTDTGSKPLADLVEEENERIV
jgi:hypothetical protein